MPALDAAIQEKLHNLQERAQRRTLYASQRGEGVVVHKNGRPLVSFSCNDYLGLTRHPQVIEAAQAALQRYGAGAGASRLITGNHPLYEQLEAQLARHKHTQAACVFGSGYLANIGTIPALAGKGDVILADKLVHACMLDGARLSGAKLLRFTHNDVAHAKQLLDTHRGQYDSCLIVTETVFSMDGDTAPVAELAALAEGYDCALMTDDAHGLGLLEDTYAEAKINHIQMGTLSKAAGSYGGYVCGSQQLVDYIKTTARSLIYSTALPPATLAASICALELMEFSPELCAAPLQHAQYFCQLLGLPPAHSAIVPLVVRDAARALALSAQLEEAGFLVAAIRPPTVPEGTSRLRFAFCAQHTAQQIETLADVIKTAGAV